MNYPPSLKLHDATLADQEGGSMTGSMTQNQEQIEKKISWERVMYGGFALLDHSLLLFSLVDYNGSCHLGKIIQVHFITI